VEKSNVIRFEDLEEVTSDKLYINHNINNVDENGLLSERIFGPRKSFKCKCGKYHHKKVDIAKRCDKCGVLITSNSVRYNTYAKINTRVPIIKKKPKFIKPKFDFILNTTQIDRIISSKIFLKVNSNSIELIDVYSDNCVPIYITGNLSLYIALKYVQNYYNYDVSEILDEFKFEILVIPPNARANNIDKEFSENSENGIADFNKLYISIIQQINMNSINVIDFNEYINDKLKLLQTLNEPDFDINTIDYDKCTNKNSS
jgi:hypothetical protein